MKSSCLKQQDQCIDIWYVVMKKEEYEGFVSLTPPKVCHKRSK